MDPTLFLHDRQSLHQGIGRLCKREGGHGVIGIHDLEDPSKELVSFLK